MQEIIIEFTIIVILSFLIAIGGSMVGISGGAFKIPVLIILFGLGSQFSTGVSLFSALFLAITSTIEYNRNEMKPIMFKIGLIIASISIPGLYAGVIIKSWITDDFIFRSIFGLSLFPIAIMMLLTKKQPTKSKTNCEIQDYKIPLNDRLRLIIAGIGFFISGIAAGIFGIGGGTVNVPVMCFILGIPMLSAIATSVFVILFTSTAGTMMNLVLIPQMSNIPLFLFYSTAIGIGSVFGSKLGADYACAIDGVLLKRFFGAILVFPLVHLMRLGQMWLDPGNVNTLAATLGDLLIWSFVVIATTIIWIKWRNNSEKRGHS